MAETDSCITTESFMRSLAEQLAHQSGGTVEAFIFTNEVKPKEENA